MSAQSPPKRNIDVKVISRELSGFNGATATTQSAGMTSLQSTNPLKAKRQASHKANTINTGQLVAFVSALILFSCVFFFVAGNSRLTDLHLRETEYFLSTRKAMAQTDYDGFFNGLPLTLHKQQRIESHVHCVGENFQSSSSWLERSCKFSFLCFDTNTSDFVLFQSKKEQEFLDHLLEGNHSFWFTSNTMHHHGSVNDMSIGGINLKWTKDGVPRLRWFPRIEKVKETSPLLDYYMLPDDVVMYPFHSLNGRNPGHLIWDDFLPFYTLLTMFHLEPESSKIKEVRPLFLRYMLPGEDRALWAACDWRDEIRDSCHTMISKFIPLVLGKDVAHTWSSTQDYLLTLKDGKATSGSHLICARHGVAGTASLTDHGSKKLHGWEKEDYQVTHNHGRGKLLLDFRNYMMRNLDLPVAPISTKAPLKIVISSGSSSSSRRNSDFLAQATMLERIPGVQVSRYEFSKMPLHEQVRVVSDANIMLTFCGGGAVTAMFLPPGASLLMFYSETGGVKNNKLTHLPAMLDWDLFSSMSHLRVHWIPSDKMKNNDQQELLELLVRHELEILTGGPL